jgi:hypothetical protein
MARSTSASPAMVATHGDFISMAMFLWFEAVVFSRPLRSPVRSRVYSTIGGTLLGKRVADRRQRRLRQYVAWHRGVNALCMEQFAWQVEALPDGVPARDRAE